MLKAFRNAFIAGLIILLPLGVTIIVINFLIKSVGDPSSRIFFFFLDPSLRQKPWVDPALSVISILVVAILITFLGYISRYFFGRFFLALAETILSRVPFINTVYNTVKQIVDTFAKQHKAVFKQVVLMEYPRKGIFAIGFLTSTSKGEIQEKTGEVVVNVFLPTTPNPTSGFLLMVPEDQITYLTMSVSDGMKLVISGGAVTPDYFPADSQEAQ